MSPLPGPPSTWPRPPATPSPSRSAPPVEVTHHGGKQLTPNGVGICNPAFDVTPAKYITAIITERGVLRAPYAESLGNGTRAAERANFYCKNVLPRTLHLSPAAKIAAPRRPALARRVRGQPSPGWLSPHRTFTARAGRFLPCWRRLGNGRDGALSRRKWSLYHAGVLILLYAELMILALIVFMCSIP